MKKKYHLISWFFQIIAAPILGYAAYGKLAGHETSTLVFDLIAMGESGKFLVGGIEALAAILLLSPMLSHWGALLGFCLMLGALIAHSTHLGLEIANDGGRSFLFLGLVLISTLSIMYIHRKKLPLIGGVL